MAPCKKAGRKGKNFKFGFGAFKGLPPNIKALLRTLKPKRQGERVGNFQLFLPTFLQGAIYKRLRWQKMALTCERSLNLIHRLSSVHKLMPIFANRAVRKLKSPYVGPFISQGLTVLQCVYIAFIPSLYFTSKHLDMCSSKG